MFTSDTVFIVVTVQKRQNSYRLCKRKPKLNQNEFAYQLDIKLDKGEWFDRIAEVEVPIMHPPQLPQLGLAVHVEQDTPSQVLERMTQ